MGKSVVVYIADDPEQSGGDGSVAPIGRVGFFSLPIMT